MPTYLYGTGLTDYVATGQLVTISEVHASKPILPLRGGSIVLLLKDFSPNIMKEILDTSSVVAVISASGSLTSHAAVLLRELASTRGWGIAGVAGISFEEAQPLLGQLITVNGPQGLVTAHAIADATKISGEQVSIPIARPEKRQPAVTTRDGIEWTCPRPSYHFTQLEQSLISPGYAHSTVTLYGKPPCAIRFDSEGRIWTAGCKGGQDIAKQIVEEPAWFSNLADRQHYRLSKILRHFLDMRPIWLEMKDNSNTRELLNAWRYVVDASYHLYRFLPLTSSSYPYLFRLFVDEATLQGISPATSLATLRTLGHSAAAASALQHKVFPTLDKEVLAFCVLAEPYGTVPSTLAPSFRTKKYARSNLPRSMAKLDDNLTKVVTLMFEAKDEKFYASSTIQSWTAHLLNCTANYLATQRPDSIPTPYSLSKYTADDIIALLAY